MLMTYCKHLTTKHGDAFHLQFVLLGVCPPPLPCRTLFPTLSPVTGAPCALGPITGILCTLGLLLTQIICSCLLFPFRMSKEDKSFMWEKRHYCHSHKNCLAKILASAPKWDVAYLGDVYALIHSWPPLTPVCALELLNSR